MFIVTLYDERFSVDDHMGNRLEFIFLDGEEAQEFVMHWVVAMGYVALVEYEPEDKSGSDEQCKSDI